MRRFLIVVILLLLPSLADGGMFMVRGRPCTGGGYVVRSIDLAPHNLTSATSQTPFVVSSSTAYLTYSSWKVFDSVYGAGKYFIGTNPTSAWVKIDLGSAKRLYSYSVRVNSIPEPDRAPKTWTFVGSNDDTNWVTLNTQASQTDWASGEVREFTLSSNTAYRYYKMNITAVVNDATYVQIGEMYLYEAEAYQFYENFDGVQLCVASDGSNCNNTWVAAGTGTATFNTTSPAMEGTNNVLLDGSANVISLYYTIATQTTMYGYAQIYVNALPAAGFRVLSFADSGGSNKGYVSIGTTGRLSINNGTSTSITADSAAGKIAAQTLYHVWWGYTKGTGSDGTYFVAFSSTGIMPTSGDNYASGTNGNANSDIARVYLSVGATGEGNTVNIDKVRARTTPIGSNPN